MSEPLPRKLGPYELVELIGRGGMAEVYRARRDGPGGFVKDLALKKILPHYANSEQLIGRFMEEARIAAALVHGNVVQVYDFGKIEGDYYIVMEYIDGMSLATVLDRCVASGIPLPTPLVAYVGAEACAGLAYAHDVADPSGGRVDVVHRDVSPQNIMLSYSGDVKIGDFGIAKAADSMIQTDVGLRLGKTSYMSPEQAAGEPLDGRSDLFALGVTLWESLTLKPLLPRGDAVGTLEALAVCSFPAITTFQPDVPPELEEVVMQALAKDPRDRYPDGEAMARRLRAYVHHTAPGFGRHDLTEYLDWLRPDGSRPSTLGPPMHLPALRSAASRPAVPSRERGPLWPWLVLALAPLLGVLAAVGTFAALWLSTADAPGDPPAMPAPAPVLPPRPEPAPVAPTARPPAVPLQPAAPSAAGATAGAVPPPPDASPQGEGDHHAPAVDEGPKPEKRRRTKAPVPRNR